MSARGGPLEVFLVALRLGLTSFGGPVAHLGFFRGEYVRRRKWLSESDFADLVALCQFLPGPASSQVGFAVGVQRAGVAGGLAAWLGFTLPSAVLMVAFALGLAHLGDVSQAGWVRGLKIAAVAVVANAVWGMGRRLCPDRSRRTLAVVSAGVVLLVAAPWMQVLVIVGGGLAGYLRFRAHVGESAGDEGDDEAEGRANGAPRKLVGTAFLPLVLFGALLLALPVAAEATKSPAVRYVDGFYRAGSLVFGGGHVVLPLLEREVVGPGWIDRDTFLAGYGAAQALPGPLFAFSSFLGASMEEGPTGVAGGALCLLAVYLPSFLLVLGILPMWAALRRWRAVQAATRGANAAVVGLLLAALYTPVFAAGIHAPLDFALALLAFGLLAYWRAPAWAVVLLLGLAGLLLL